MDVLNLLAEGAAQPEGNTEGPRQSHQYPTRQALTSLNSYDARKGIRNSMESPAKAYNGLPAAGGPRPSPNGKQQKHVMFELLLNKSAQHRARLPMRVMISPHDTTESILTTVRNFYGLYEGPGVSFEDREGNIIIARHENFENDMTVYVRVTTPDPEVVAAASGRVSLSPRKPKLGAPFEMRPPSRNQTRHGSNAANGRSVSPQSNKSYRSNSALPGAKSRGRSTKSREPTALGEVADGYSDSDGGNGSVTSSRRSKVEPHASAEISVDNIVEGGRRKRAKFESSELPLFVPPQVPVAASNSSVSPVRRANGIAGSPAQYSNQYTFSYTQPLPSPQSYGRLSNEYGSAGAYGAGSYNNRGRPVSYSAPRQSTGGILPTPEPTVGSVISDEDVALQLMRLGDMSNFSHGRTSTSTLDDALSGKAEAASSGEESEAEDDLPAIPRYSKEESGRSHTVGPQRKKQRMLEENLPSDTTQDSGDEYEDQGDGSFNGDSDEIMPDQDSALGSAPRRDSKSKASGASRVRGSVSSISGSIKSAKSRAPGPVKLRKTSSNAKVPMSPASLPSQSRKTSTASTVNQLGADEEDLSTKPRCQRCRKSKKGCDRQRPCGRCRDAGIGIEGCISEDEGNGRKGRYGRHMGVPVKATLGDVVEKVTSVSTTSASNGHFLAPALPSDKNKKRKR